MARTKTESNFLGKKKTESKIFLDSIFFEPILAHVWDSVFFSRPLKMISSLYPFLTFFSIRVLETQLGGLKATYGFYWLRLLNYCWEDCIFLVQTYPKSYRNIARVYPRAATGIFYGLFWSKILTKNGNPMWLPEKTCFNLHDMQPVIKFFFYYLVYQNCASKRAISFAFNSFDQFDLWKPLTTLCNWTVFGKRKNSKK